MNSRAATVANNVLSSLVSGFSTTTEAHNIPLIQLIDAACDVGSLTTEITYHPNVDLNYEIVDMINRKKNSGPREVAMRIVSNVNSRYQRTSMLALTLLDTCAKNCGYPFHLIISTKEFLNELVRRFPERPTTISAVQYRILELIQQWNATLCVTSRYKEDFKHINDMYRLLSYKGYRFPPLSDEATLALNQPPSLKTEHELEEEDKVVQGAKLQELLRLATPAALEQANDLMKVMAGYDEERRPDYKKEVNDELDRIEQRTMLLNDILNNKTAADRGKSDPTVDELISTTCSAQTRIQKLISGGENDERVERLLELNDLINTVLQKGQDFTSGKFQSRNIVSSSSASSNTNLPIKSVTSPTGSNNTSPVASHGPINLIDFDFNSIPVHSSGVLPSLSYVAQKDVMALSNDLSNLNFGGSSGQFGMTSSAAAAAPVPKPSNASNNLNDLLGIGLSRLVPQNSNNTLKSTAAITSIPIGNNMSGFSQLNSETLLSHQGISNASQLIGNMGAAQPIRPMMGGNQMNSFQQQPVGSMNQIVVSNNNVQQNNLLGDDFLGLGGLTMAKPSSQSGSDHQFGAMSSFQGMSHQAPVAQTTAPQPAIAHQRTPSSGNPEKREVGIYDKNGVQIKFRLIWKETFWLCQAVFLNTTPVPFGDLAFQLALPKSMTLQMEPLSGTVIPPFNTHQIIQNMQIANPTKDQLRIRFKLTYSVNGAIVNEQGEYNDTFRF